MDQKRIVNNVKNWVDMDGETILERRLNSLLTVNFVGYRNIYSDECLEYALALIDLKAKQSSREDVSNYLEKIFRMKPSNSLLDKIDQIFVKWHKVKETSYSYQ